MAELIAPGTTLANSADFTVVAGVPNTLYIKPDPAANPSGKMGCEYWLQHKTSAGDYVTIQILSAANITQLGTIFGVGTFRVQRQASVNSTGMDIE